MITISNLPASVIEHATRFSEIYKKHYLIPLVLGAGLILPGSVVGTVLGGVIGEIVKKKKDKDVPVLDKGQTLTKLSAKELKEKLASLGYQDKEKILSFLKTQKSNDIKFETYLQKLIVEKGYVPADIIRLANMEKGHFYQILRGDRKPIRNTVIKLAIILGLTVEETDLLLQKANHNELYAFNRRDGAIIYCLSCRLKLDDVDAFLSMIDEAPLCA